ncbi:hypothetical protein FS842_002060 [Serendipita sp. 407]|nr:hypothetical protein FS842_002060 [Serendipita sp. 407]
MASEHQHNAFTVGLGGLYPCPEVVQDVLAPVEGVKKAVLDLGCGTGAWMLAMAQEFPHATFLGVDLIPCPHPTSDIPQNCMFEIDDINKGLEHFEGQFDLVHARCITFGISNYRKTMEEISLCLKPGGLAIFIEADLDLLAEDRTTILPIALTDKEIREAIARSEQKGLTLSEAEKASLGEGAWLQRIAYEVVYSATLNGSDIPGAEEAVDEGLWRMNMFDPALCGASSVFTPVTPWPRMRDPEQSQKVKYAGSLMRQDAHNALRAFHPLLRKYGVSQSIIDQWTAAADWELTSQKFRCWTRLRVAWGRRKQRKERGSPSGHSTEPSTSPSPSSSGTKGQQFLLHQVEVYNSREEALSAKEARLSTRDPRPLPFVARLARGESIAL